MLVTNHVFLNRSTMEKLALSKQLKVSGAPFLAIGGEIGNSTASNLDLLRQSFEKLSRMRLNTVMLPVYWDRIEPLEGEFDFTLVQGAIELAREFELRLVYLWFGTWKNSMSCYAPSWVKRGTSRFPRARDRNRESMEIVSAESAEAVHADVAAFTALMKWTKVFDEDQQTVILVQVENEVGMIEAARDHSALADAGFSGQVPEVLLGKLIRHELGQEVAEAWDRAGNGTSGTWSKVFGDGSEAEEFYTAWRYAEYIEQVARAGKQVYDLPMFANAALIRPGYQPGQYPSGGPLPHLMEIWQAAAPSLDMVSPDIYFPNFGEWVRRYFRSGNPIFIPEMAPSARASANAVYAVAQCGAIGFGPFAIEDVDAERERDLAECFALLSGMSELILEAQREGRILGFTPDIDFDWNVLSNEQEAEHGGIRFRVRFDCEAASEDSAVTELPTLGTGRWEVPTGVPLGSVMIIQIAEVEFIILGKGVVVTFASEHGIGKVGIDQVQEGRFEAGTWVGGRWLNGDQTHQGRHIHLCAGKWSIQRVRLYRYD